MVNIKNFLAIDALEGVNTWVIVGIIAAVLIVLLFVAGWRFQPYRSSPHISRLPARMRNGSCPSG